MSAPEASPAASLARRVASLAVALAALALVFERLPGWLAPTPLGEFPIVAPVVAGFAVLTLLERVFSRLWP